MTDEEAISTLAENPKEIVTRLRARAQLWRGASSEMMREHASYIDEAADEIERLRIGLRIAWQDMKEAIKHINSELGE